MPDPTESDLTPRTSPATAEVGRDDEIEMISAELSRRGLATPAAILLDAHRPLLPVLRQAALFLAPFAAPLLGRRRIDLLRATAADPVAYDHLTERLAARRSDRPAGGGEREP